MGLGAAIPIASSVDEVGDCVVLGGEVFRLKQEVGDCFRSSES